MQSVMTAGRRPGCRAPSTLSERDGAGGQQCRESKRKRNSTTAQHPGQWKNRHRPNLPVVVVGQQVIRGNAHSVRLVLKRCLLSAAQEPDGQPKHLSPFHNLCYNGLTTWNSNICI